MSIINLLYSAPICSADVLDDIDVLIYDMDRSTIDITCTDKLAAKHDAQFRNMITSIDPRDALSLFDKLMARQMVDRIIKLHCSSRINYGHAIVNHALPNDDIITAYSQSYRVIYNNTISPTTCLNMSVCNAIALDHVYNRKPQLSTKSVATSLLIPAISNGMHVTKIYGPLANDNIMQFCTSLTELDATENKQITTCVPFAKSLKYLTVGYHSKITDDGLHGCTSLSTLNIHNNNTITTCEPFARSIRKLSATGYYSSINDDKLKICTLLEELNASDNVNITTCKPFAKSLRTLYARDQCHINNDGLSGCTSLTALYIDSNSRINILTPFASTLRILSACERLCKISDASLSICTSIGELHANNNSLITTCAPFAKTLTILSANNQCGISDYGLRLCQSITDISIVRNEKVTTCKPFARSLQKLSIGCNQMLNNKFASYKHIITIMSR